MYSRSYGVRNTWLNNCLQRRISEEPSRVNTWAETLFQSQGQHLYDINRLL